MEKTSSPLPEGRLSIVTGLSPENARQLERFSPSTYAFGDLAIDVSHLDPKPETSSSSPASHLPKA
ncbi:MAG: hypothetical protein AAB383_05185 [Patescibacteria group bacterium]